MEEFEDFEGYWGYLGFLSEECEAVGVIAEKGAVLELRGYISVGVWEYEPGASAFDVDCDWGQFEEEFRAGFG